jgi:hypothetical protein
LEEDANYNHTKQHGMADLLEEGFFFLDEDNFIEQYWGAAKFHYRTSPKMDNINKMEGL